MLTTTIDGLWALQVLAGIEVLAPELGLRAHLPRVEKRHAALSHPIAAELRSAGVIGPNGNVDRAVIEWLTVLARRDVALLICMQTPGGATESDRVVLARFANWWVTLERSGELVRLSPAGTATTEESAVRVIAGQIDRLCGDLAPARIPPVTLDAEQMIASVGCRDGLRSALYRQRLNEDQVGALVAASDPRLSTQLSIVAMQSGITGENARTHVGCGAVTVIDSPAGRLLVEHTSRDDKSWMIVAPGSAAHVGAAVQRLLRRLPAQADWHTYRRAV